MRYRQYIGTHLKEQPQTTGPAYKSFVTLIGKRSFRALNQYKGSVEGPVTR